VLCSCWLLKLVLSHVQKSNTKKVGYKTGMRKVDNQRNVESFRRQSAIRQAKMSQELSDELNLANMCESCAELFVELLNCCFACLTCQSARKDPSEEVKIHLEDKERNMRRLSTSNIATVPIQKEILGIDGRRPSSSRVSSSRKKSRKSKINYDDEIADPQNNMYSDDERKVIVFHPHSFPEVSWDPSKKPRRSSLAVSSERKQSRRSTITRHRNSIFVPSVKDDVDHDVQISTYEPTGRGILKNISVKPENNEESGVPQGAPPDKERPELSTLDEISSIDQKDILENKEA